MTIPKVWACVYPRMTIPKGLGQGPTLKYGHAYIPG